MKRSKQDNTGRPEDKKPDAHSGEPTMSEMDASEEHRGFQTSLNDELVEKIKDNPNKFIGCGS